jgi:hypothetical protein
VTDRQAPPPTDLDQFEARVKAAAAVVESAAQSLESEWGAGSAYDVYEIARLLGADVYAADFAGPDVPALIAELDAAREVVREMRDHQINDQIPCAWCAEKLAAYDRAVEGGGK